MSPPYRGILCRNGLFVLVVVVIDVDFNDKRKRPQYVTATERAQGGAVVLCTLRKAVQDGSQRGCGRIPRSGSTLYVRIGKW